jgi:hypothetical protein
MSSAPSIASMHTSPMPKPVLTRNSGNGRGASAIASVPSVNMADATDSQFQAIRRLSVGLGSAKRRSSA